MQRASLLLLIGALFPLQDAVQPKRDLPSHYEVTEAYAVYSAVVPDDWLVKNAHPGTVLIRAETEHHWMCLQPGDDEAETRLVGPAIENYKTQNAKSQLLQRKFNLDLPYELLSSDEIASWSRGSNWARFHARHPDYQGWLELSAVGFNSEKTIAVVYMGHHCGILCGGGGFAFLRKEEGKWKPMTFHGLSCNWAS